MGLSIVYLNEKVEMRQQNKRGEALNWIIRRAECFKLWQRKTERFVVLREVAHLSDVSSTDDRKDGEN